MSTTFASGWPAANRRRLSANSSVARGQPARFKLSRLIKGWQEGIALMTKGEKRRFWIPVDLAYQGKPGKPAGMLVFDVELLAFSPE